MLLHVLQYLAVCLDVHLKDTGWAGALCCCDLEKFYTDVRRMTTIFLPQYRNYTAPCEDDIITVILMICTSFVVCSCTRVRLVVTRLPFVCLCACQCAYMPSMTSHVTQLRATVWPPHLSCCSYLVPYIIFQSCMTIILSNYASYIRERTFFLEWITC